MIKNNFWFGVILTISILVCAYSFQIAYVMRGCYALGGEVFTIALPLTIVFNKIYKMEEKLNRKSQYIKKLEERLKRK